MAERMDRSMYRFVLKHSGRQQLYILIFVAISWPIGFMLFDVPKQIINRALGGEGPPFTASADLADGFGGGRTRDQKLDIMRDSRLGTYGVLSLAVIVIAKIAALAAIAAVDIGAAAGALIAAAAWSRSMFAPTMRWLPPARDEGLAALAGTPTEGATWKGLALGALLAALVLITPAGGGLLLILAAGGAGAFAVGWLALRQIDGYTGDVLGGVQQAAEAAVLIVASAVVIGNAA